MPTWRSWWPLIVVLLLSGCFGGDDFWMGGSGPAAVYFPDDPRVLHGAWQLQLGSMEYPPLHRLSGDGQALLLWSNDRNPLHLANPEGEYLAHQPAIPFEGIHMAAFDRSRDTLVWFRAADDFRSVLVRQRAITGGPVHEMRVAMPPGRWFGIGYAVQGQLVIVSHTEADSDGLLYHQLDPVDGRYLSSLPLPPFLSPLRTFSGRAIVFQDWHFDVDLTHVIDTRQPDRIISFEQRSCDTDAVADLSESGRWLLYGGCGNDMFLLDLDQPEPRPQRLLWADARARPTFAFGSDEIVWFGVGGGIGRYDPASGERLDLELGPDAPAFFLHDWDYPPVWYADLGLLIYPATEGRLAVLHVDGGQVTSMQVLPHHWFEQAELDLVASDLSADGSRYSVSGELRSETGTFQLQGTVVSQRLHFYRPSPSASEPSLPSGEPSPPFAEETPNLPRVVFEIRATDAFGEHAFDLWAVTYQRGILDWWDVRITDPDDHQAWLRMSRP